MKKLFVSLLCVAMLLCCGNTVFAAELPFNESTGQGTVTYMLTVAFV